MPCGEKFYTIQQVYLQALQVNDLCKVISVPVLYAVEKLYIWKIMHVCYIVCKTFDNVKPIFNVSQYIGHFMRWPTKNTSCFWMVVIISLWYIDVKLLGIGKLKNGRPDSEPVFSYQRIRDVFDLLSLDYVSFFRKLKYAIYISLICYSHKTN